jgi:Lysine methyltransferase
MSGNEFNMDELARAMAPTDKVLDAFAREVSQNNQHDFAIRIQDMWNDFGPSKRYLRNLVRRFIRRIEAEGQAVEDEGLLILVLKCSQSSDIFPDPSESGYQSFRIHGDEADGEPLRVRVYPQHNDIALRLWEAGGVLAEYLMQYPLHVSGKAVLDTGAGVGLTGLVVARYCGAAKVLMTDYTVESLLNVSHNIALNETWLRKGHGSPEVTQVRFRSIQSKWSESHVLTFHRVS